MDSFDIFRQLTYGVRFSNSKPRKLKPKPVVVDEIKLQHYVKDEIKVEGDYIKEESDDSDNDYYNGNNTSSINNNSSTEYDSDFKIKEEIKSEDESDERDGLNILCNVSFPKKRKNNPVSIESEKQMKIDQMEVCIAMNHLLNNFLNFNYMPIIYRSIMFEI